MGVRALEAAEVGAVARARARDEEAHLGVLRERRRGRERAQRDRERGELQAMCHDVLLCRVFRLPCGARTQLSAAWRK